MFLLVLVGHPTPHHQELQFPFLKMRKLKERRMELIPQVEIDILSQLMEGLVCFMNLGILFARQQDLKFLILQSLIFQNFCHKDQSVKFLF